MSQTLRLLLTVVTLMLTTHPLPAPIFEIPEKATPTPTPAKKARPAPEPQPKSRPKPPVESKPKSERGIEIIPPSAPRKHEPYAGTWTGIMSHGLRGNRENTIIIDDTQTTMKVWDVKTPNGHTFSGPASVGAGGISAALGLTGGTWTLKPYPDGKTAEVGFKAAYFHRSAIFRREN